MSGDPTGIPLDIQGELARRGLSGKLAVIAEGLPTGAALSAGANKWDGTWSLGLDDLSGLRFIAPTGQIGGHTLTIRVLRLESDSFDVGTTAAVFDMRVGHGAGGADLAEPSGEAAPAAQPREEWQAKAEAKLAAAQAQRRSEEEQLRRDDKAEQSEMDETSVKNVAADQRLTVRLLVRWHELRGNRRCPLASEFLSSIPPELLPDCFNFVSGKSFDEGGNSLGNKVARIAAIRSLEDALKGNPIPDNGEFEDETGQRYLYRAIFLPLEDDEGEIIQVICGATCKARAIAEPSVPKILVIDDDPQITKALMIRLGALGLEVVRSPNVKVGALLAMMECPDLIITHQNTHQNMSEISSEYLLIKLKGEDKTKDIPVIVITSQKVDGHEDLSLKRELLGRCGAAAYFSRPVDFNALLNVLNRHIRVPCANVAEPSGEAAPAAQAQRRSEEEQLRRDEKVEQSELDETSTMSVAADLRLTMRLMAQWHQLRGNRRCPLASEFLNSIPPELLPDCFIFTSGKSLDEGRLSHGGNVMRISGITKRSLLLAEVPGNTLLGAAIRSLEDALKGNPIPDNGEFEDETGQRYLYRAILLPLEDDEGEIIGVICCARCKAFVPLAEEWRDGVFLARSQIQLGWAEVQVGKIEQGILGEHGNDDLAHKPLRLSPWHVTVI